MLPLSAILKLPGVRLSPLGVVPQQDRRLRLIVDYTYSGVNQDTVKMAPPEAMQFGRALQRVITNIVHSDPKFRPCKLTKIDNADGFKRMRVRILDILKLGVVLPSATGQPTLALPISHGVS